MPRIHNDFYIVGGTIVPGSESYVKRDADTTLYEQIQRRELSYVLTSRQMGKSSLIAATAARLRSDGVRTATADLTLIGGKKVATSATQWYYGIVRVIVRQLQLDLDLQAWWQERQSMTALKRLMEFFRELVKVHCPNEDVVVFIDEIETTIDLPFSDDLFAVIRACHNAKAEDVDLQRLTFVLIGVATPGELINNPKRTPFNVGQRVDLTDFTKEEAKQLTAELRGDPDAKADVLSRILYWTGGHPFLTHKLCSKLADMDREAIAHHDVDRLVEELFTSPGASSQEDNLRMVRDRLTRKGDERRQVLRMYARIHSGMSQSHSPVSTTQTTLKLSGIVRIDGESMLRVRNRIYEKVFTADWARAEMPIDWFKRSAVASVSILILCAVYWYEIVYPKPIIFTLEQSLMDKTAAKQAYVALRQIPFYHRRADGLWADFWTRRGEYAIEQLDYEIANEAFREMNRIPGIDLAADALHARFWDARAVNASWQQDRDACLIATLKALCIHDTVDRRRRISQLIGVDYQSLDQTLRSSRNALSCYAGRGKVVEFSPDQRYALTHPPDGPPLVVDLATEDVIDCIQGSPVGFSPESHVLVQDSSKHLLHLLSPVDQDLVNRGMNHDGEVDQHLFSEESNVLLTRVKLPQSSATLARLWNYLEATPIGKALELESGIGSIALSRDGSLAVCGDLGGNVGIWDASTGNLLHKESYAAKRNEPAVPSPGESNDVDNFTSESHANSPQVTAIAITSRGTRIAIGYNNGTVFLLDNKGQCVSHFKHSSSEILWIAIDPSDQVMLVASLSNSVEFRNVSDGTRIGSVQVGSFGGHSMHEREPIFSRTGRFVAIPDSLIQVDDHSAIRVVSTRDARPLPAPVLVRDDASCLDFSPDEHYIAIGSSDGTAQEYRISDGRPVGRPLGHRECVIDIEYMGHDNEVRLATGTICGLARLWTLDRNELAIGKSTIIVRGGIDHAIVSGDGSVVATIDDAGKPGFWHSDGRLSAPDLPTIQPSGSIRLSSTGEVAALVHESGEVQILKTDDGMPLASFPNYNRATTAPPGSHAAPNTQRVLASALSPNGEMIGLVNDAGVVEFVNWRQDARAASTITKPEYGGEDTQLDGAAAAVTIESSNGGSRIRHHLDVAFSPDGRRFLVGGGDGLLQILDVKTSEILSTRQVANATTESVAVAFANGGKMAVFGDSDGRLAFYWPDRPDTGGASTFHLNFDITSKIHSIVASPDGNFITVIAGWPYGVTTFVHRFDVSDKHPELVFSRPISQAPRDILGIHALDPSAKRIQLLLRSANDTIEATPILMGLDDTQPIAGNPHDLLATWERRLRLPFDLTLGSYQRNEGYFEFEPAMTTEQELKIPNFEPMPAPTATEDARGDATPPQTDSEDH